MTQSEVASPAGSVPALGADELRRARRALALTPVGLVVGFLLVMAVATMMGVPVVTVVVRLIID